MPATRISFILGVAAAALVSACAAEDMPHATEGRDVFQPNCAVCHGVSGQGDGPLAADLERTPADLTLIAARNGGVFPVAAVLSHIDGYTRSDLGVPNMPEFGALLGGDLVPFDTGDGVQTPTPRKLVALVEYLHSIQASN